MLQKAISFHILISARFPRISARQKGSARYWLYLQSSTTIALLSQMHAEGVTALILQRAARKGLGKGIQNLRKSQHTVVFRY